MRLLQVVPEPLQAQGSRGIPVVHEERNHLAEDACPAPAVRRSRDGVPDDRREPPRLWHSVDQQP